MHLSLLPHIDSDQLKTGEGPQKLVPVRHTLDGRSVADDALVRVGEVSGAFALQENGCLDFHRRGKQLPAEESKAQSIIQPASSLSP